MSYVSLAVIGVVVILFIVMIFKSIVVVSQSETMIVELLGRYRRTLQSGIHVIWPIIEKPGAYCGGQVQVCRGIIC